MPTSGGAESPDVPQRIADFNRGREPERLALKYAVMRANAFAFYRGTAHLFWEDLARAPDRLPHAPLAWACGDLHLENFGSYRGDNRLAYFDVNDFDEACIAPAAWEVARFLTSVHLAVAELALPADVGVTLSDGFLDAYQAVLADGTARWLERATAVGMVRDLLRAVRHRSQRELLDGRTHRRKWRRVLRVDGRHALAISDDDRARLGEALSAFAATQPDPRFFTVLDAARRVAGTGSLGVRRFVILVGGRGSPDANVLLDIKEARPSALAPYVHAAQPVWESDAARVVATQHMMQAVPPALLERVRIGDCDYVLRELQPTDDRLKLSDAHGRVRRLRVAAATMGRLVAWSQLRSSGRRGSATADDLQAFAAAPGWRHALVGYARGYVATVHHDWTRFVAAGRRNAR